MFSVAQALKGYLFTGDNAFMRMASFIAVSSSWLEGWAQWSGPGSVVRVRVRVSWKGKGQGWHIGITVRVRVGARARARAGAKV